jgi:DNA invertase Pin-like site-specific DNA recombinase
MRECRPTDRPWRTQDAALWAAGCAKGYSETASGAKTDRAALRKAVARLDEGDVLMVTRLDRLAGRRVICSIR